MEIFCLLIFLILVVFLLAGLKTCLSEKLGTGDSHFDAVMTDAAFTAALPAGTNEALALKVRSIVSEQLMIPYECVRPETYLEQC